MLNKNLRYSVKLNKGNWIVKLCCLFLATDIGFILLHLVYSYSDLISNDIFSLEKDRGYSEIFQYVKEYWSALLLGLLAIQGRSLLYLSWSVLFFYLLLDDSVQIHENLGALISSKFSFPAILNLRAVDLGELVVSAVVSLFFLIAIGINYRLGDRLSREVSKSLIILLFALAIFGVFMDMLHVVLSTPFLDPLLILVEDGGELMIMSLIVCFVFSLPLKSSKLIE
ncbi:hypothetical protein I8751_08525 [Nostocaceae cyanobacterium CENA357]|uniref:Uncharacterized protein n=1 Tax=Atlanticothrix silvestris CENA357 TaxID=1725252 RepID=A0A8J7HB36_9CYAN|nr:hypothetical protein [Atlanticothrix silvestris CENA357]